MSDTPTFSTAAVSAPHQQGADVGQMVLASGGNAIEAVVAMAATCAVMLPHLTGLAGDGFWLVREPHGKIHAIDASGPSGSLATIARYRKAGHDSLPVYGEDAALTVAGSMAGWSLALELARSLGGRLPLDMLLSEAIGVARDGAASSPSEARCFVDPRLRDLPGFADTFLTNSENPEPGALRRQPRLADMLERLSHAGLMDFYRGDAGREIALDLERMGAPILRRDLETTRARIVSSLSARLHHADIVGFPAPTHGLAGLLTLAIADRCNDRASDNAGYHHALIEACKSGLSIAGGVIADPRDIDGDLAAYLDGSFVADRALRIDRMRSAPATLPQPAPSGGAWFGCIDKNGLAVSYTQSVGGLFGSGCVLPATGLLWHNAGAAFSLDPHDLNALAPGRKPPQGFSPALTVHADGRVMVHGGGTAAMAQGFSRYAQLGMGLAEAVAFPRWTLEREGNGKTLLRVEDGFDPGLQRALSQRGHRVEESSAEEVGLGGMIVRYPRNGRVEAASDPRGDGAVSGL